jgi:hypothetical protein
MASIFCDKQSSRQDAVMPVDADEELRVLTALFGCLMVADADVAVEGSTRSGSMPLPHGGQGADK